MQSELMTDEEAKIETPVADDAVTGEQTAEGAVDEEVVEEPKNSKMRWYVVHAYSGFEGHVKRSLQERVERAGMQDLFGEILVPTEEVVEMREGNRRKPLGYQAFS